MRVSSYDLLLVLLVKPYVNLTPLIIIPTKFVEVPRGSQEGDRTEHRSVAVPARSRSARLSQYPIILSWRVSHAGLRSLWEWRQGAGCGNNSASCHTNTHAKFCYPLSIFELHGRPFMPKGSTPKARPKRASSKPAVKRKAEVAAPKGAAKKLKK